MRGVAENEKRGNLIVGYVKEENNAKKEQIGENINLSE